MADNLGRALSKASDGNAVEGVEYPLKRDVFSISLASPTAAGTQGLCQSLMPLWQGACYYNANSHQRTLCFLLLEFCKTALERNRL
jgi:hypothetical protein